jgi:hypothetical protein
MTVTRLVQWELGVGLGTPKPLILHPFITMPLHCVHSCPKNFETSRKASLTHHQALCPAFLAHRTAAEHLRATRSNDKKERIAARNNLKSNLKVFHVCAIASLAPDPTFSRLTGRVVWANHPPMSTCQQLQHLLVLICQPWQSYHPQSAQ